MVSRTLPLGQRESLEYDAEGNQTAKVTFKGDRLEYDFDGNGRMIRKRVPGYSEYVLTYTATGQRESVLDYRGLTSYEYDSRDRLLHVDNPEGKFVSYTYDLAGNRASVTSPSQTVGYTYYADNRMEDVLERGGGMFTYSYDRAGNQIGLSYPNGVNETRTYDVVPPGEAVRAPATPVGVQRVPCQGKSGVRVSREYRRR
ncbi:MAG: RHS repeat protein [Deltaproteobacteria bacterium]|nr:RHS repeat protein [Deltaproteobacteria bacterium]